jgi:formyltetrahydrofolate-dependent phosphoribosylglycinamide formyltransferase
MFKKLQERWKVNMWNLILIIATFAFGGTTCGKLSGFLLKLWSDDKTFVWWVLYIILVTILWPFCVLLISIPLGQFKFFKNYIQRIAKKMMGKKGSEKNIQINIAIFASGNGTNADNIISHLKTISNLPISVSLIVTDKENAGIHEVAFKNNIPIFVIPKSDIEIGDEMLKHLKNHQIAFIILAGYLKKVPGNILQSYERNVINIHPALLPKHGGKGMYGKHVHETVLANKEIESGITIHYVDEIYDNGEIILQEKCSISENETAETLAEKIHQLEYAHYPEVIASLLKTKINVKKTD